MPVLSFTGTVELAGHPPHPTGLADPGRLRAPSQFYLARIAGTANTEHCDCPNRSPLSAASSGETAQGLAQPGNGMRAYEATVLLAGRLNVSVCYCVTVLLYYCIGSLAAF